MSPSRFRSVPVSVMVPKPGWLWYEAPIHEFSDGFQITPALTDAVMLLTSTKLRPSCGPPLALTRSSLPSALRARRSEIWLSTTLTPAPRLRRIFGM